jgi:hypothetical protein
MNAPAQRHVLPLWTKLAFTAYMLVLVPTYWHSYGPTNFLYFCDLALFFTLIAFWTERSLFASMPAVGILLPQTLWCIDFFGTMFGHPLVGLTAYMFDEQKSLFLRGLSFFHFWLPFLLIWMVWRLGYDRRAFLCWTVLACGLQLLCYFTMPAPPAPADQPNLPVNINYVYGLSDDKPQEWMPPLAYLGTALVALPTLIFLPTHLLLRWAFRDPNAAKVAA